MCSITELKLLPSAYFISGDYGYLLHLNPSLENIIFAVTLGTILENVLSFHLLTSGKPTSTSKVKMLVCFNWKGSCLMQWSVNAVITACHWSEEVSA